MSRALLLVFLAIGGCGEEIVRCGNGIIEGGEQCDDGNFDTTDGCDACRTKPVVTTTLRWSLIATQFEDFNETCLGVGAQDIELVVDGPMPFTVRRACDDAQIVWRDLPDGDYTVTARLFAAGGEPVTKGESSVSFSIASASEMHELDIAYEDFTVTPTGTFFFRTLWGGMRICGPVAKQILGLSRGGVPIITMTNAGDAVDGTTASPCRPAAGSTSQAILGVTWGPVRLVVTGLDSADQPLYRSTFDTFAGAGASNPSYELDVAPLDGGL